MPSSYGASVSVMKGSGNGTFEPGQDFTTGTEPWGLVVRDFDGDGKLDLATANHGEATTSVLRGNGDGTFQGKIDYITGAMPYGVAAADLDGDGMLDLAVLTWTAIR